MTLIKIYNQKKKKNYNTHTHTHTHTHKRKIILQTHNTRLQLYTIIFFYANRLKAVGSGRPRCRLRLHHTFTCVTDLRCQKQPRQQSALAPLMPFVCLSCFYVSLPQSPEGGISRRSPERKRFLLRCIVFTSSCGIRS